MMCRKIRRMHLFFSRKMSMQLNSGHGSLLRRVDMAVKLSPLERIQRTLNFQDVDFVAAGEIIQNSGLIDRFVDREVRNDWTLEELASTYRELEIDVGMLMASASTPRIEKRHGITYQVSYWSEWVTDRPFDDVKGLKRFLENLIVEVKGSRPDEIWSYAGKGGILGQGFDDYGKYFAYLKKKISPAIPCHIESPIGLDVIYNMAGWELYSYLLADDPGIISETFEALNEHEVNRVHLIADSDISPLVIVYCDIASKHDVILSPLYLRAEFFPRLKRLVEAWHEHGIKVIFHSEGNLKKVMDDLITCGIDGINPLEPENISLEYVRKNYPKLVLWGGIDDKTLLPFGTEDQVEEAVKSAIEVCSNGGLILGASGEIHPEVKPENAVALFRAAKKYGCMNSS
ncbi:MAG TPA: hypothetical protein ENI15_13765 [Spirochaetes bacterium]|nr:hypothetical protein [Spirochaetota bacterium]